MEKATSYSDKHLVSLAQQGNMHAYNLLFERYNSKILKIIYFQIHDHANLNDLAQDVLIKVFRYLPDFKEQSEFSTWLYKITKNTIKNHYRILDQRLEGEAQYLAGNEDTFSDSPERGAINLEFNEQLELALAALPEDLRTSYSLHTFEGQSYEDIAVEMNCPIGTVRSRIFRARKLLIDFMDGV